MKKIILGLTLLISVSLFAQKPIFTTAKVKAATVYVNSAELSQTTSVSLPKGTSEIVIKNVADYLNESTVQIKAPKNTTVLSVQFTKNYISEYEIDESNPAIKKVRDSINLVTKEINKVYNQRTSYNKTIELLDKNQQVSGANSALSVTELMKLVDYYNTKRTELSNLVNTYTEKESKLKEKLSKLNSKLEINTKNEEKTSKGKLILQVMNDFAGTVDLDINYLTQGASWQPFYDLRAENISSPIDMLYKGQVTQNTGIDWKKVKLTLSSGNPNQSNIAPILQAWFLRFGNPNYGYNNRNLNASMNVIQSMDKKYKAEAEELKESTVSDYTTISENQLNISFDIDVPYDILSNGKAHSVALKEIKLPASYKYYGVPKMEKEAFLLAEINDYSKFNLLPGEANIIFEGTYVGKTFINPNETADTLNLSMGRDKKISIKREKVVDKSGTKFLSSYKEQIFTYDIIVRNNKKESIDMLLKDQYPISTDKEIIIELLEKDKAKVNEETGVLTWKINLKSNETKKFRISYKVKYPKDKIIQNL
ncbi:membrane protein [Flavobacterium sp. 316]|uniref:mucoidy inhibitor MuiA family protein n=1 Tax=Flavobacterium sp. 316 TaxID=1603293 RepID=UPI0005E166B0|nr:mucoidy inhibitor MuiA family protein [Flavobacterium sp. 316]KIX21133.1 membrane protein [Flavobacterium sp. 316]